MFSEEKLKKKAKLLLFLATIIWGSALVVVKNVLDSMPVFWLLTLRFGTSALVLWFLFRKSFPKLDKTTLYHGTIMGFFLFLGYGLMTVGLQFTTPGKAAFLTAVYCIIVPLIYWIVDKIKPDRYNGIASILCFFGIGCISLGGDFSVNPGDLLVLFGGIGFAANIVAVAKSVRKGDLYLLTTLQFFTFSIFTWICAITTESFFPPPIPLDALLQIIYLTFFATAICFLLQNMGQKYTTPTTASLILALEAPFSVSISVMTGHDILTPQMILGFCLVFCGIICSETKLAFLSKGAKN